MDAAFCSAVRVTLVGSMTPAATRSSSSKDYYHRYVLNPEGVSVYVPEGRDAESLPEAIKNEIRRQLKGQS